MNTAIKALFIPCTLDGYARHTGSIRLRAEWIVKYWPGAALYTGQQSLAAYELVVFQKAYLSAWSRAMLVQLAAYRATHGAPTLALDLCDPDFLDEEHRRRLLDGLPAFDCATAPTQPLVDWLSQYLPAYLVPDTVDPDAITAYHGFAWPGRPRLVWLGYRGNETALSPAMRDLIHKSGLSLEIVTIAAPLPFAEWLAILTEYDVLLNPRPTTGKFAYKSDNKTRIAWQAGVAVVETEEDLRALANPEQAAWWVSRQRQAYAAADHHPHTAVAAWQAAYQHYQETYYENLSR